MVASGLVTGTSGNVSARTLEGDVLITPSGLDYEVLEPEDVGSWTRRAVLWRIL